MRPRSPGRVRIRGTLILLGVLTFASGQVLADDSADDAGRAVRLYDAGRYAESLEILERLNFDGGLSGPMLYRLAFARDRTGDKAGSAQAADLALATLEGEYETAPTLEIAFYLSNAYRNARRTDDSRRIAEQATARIDSGDWPQPTAALDLFRMGKLYQDRSRRPEAIEWYERALVAMEKDADGHVGYLRWIHRYLGNVSISSARYDEAEAHFAALASLDNAGPQDYDLLAIARARLGKWAAAEATWREAERLDPASADRARYCYRLMNLAAATDALPDSAPSGKPFTSVPKEELEALMNEQADVVNQAREEAVLPENAGDDRRAELQTRVDAARRLFVAAAVEYALRKLPIRETAFFGGYAPLIFHSSRWELPDAVE